MQSALDFLPCVRCRFTRVAVHAEAFRHANEHIQLKRRKPCFAPSRPIERPAQLNTHVVADQAEEGFDRLDAVAFAAILGPASAGGDVGDFFY